MSRRWNGSARWPVVVLAAVMALAGARAASAQYPVAAVPLLGDSQFINLSGRHIVAYTQSRLTADDSDDAFDVYVYTIDGSTWRRLPTSILAGIPAPGFTHRITARSLSDDGRYLAYEWDRVVLPTSPLVPPTLSSTPVLARYDLQTGRRSVLRDAQHDPYRHPVMSRDGSTFAWIGDHNAVIVRKPDEGAVTVGEACPAALAECPSRPALTARGEQVLFLRATGLFEAAAWLERIDLRTHGRELFPEFRPLVTPGPLATTASGRHVLVLASDGARQLFDLATRRSETIPPTGFTGEVALALSDDAEYVLGATGTVYDRRASWYLASGGATSRGLTSDGRYIAVTLPGAVFALLDLDHDQDGMPDPWETLYGLDATTATDASLDTDGDGRSNREEYAARSHPRGRYRRFFAEGVSSPTFETGLFITGGPAPGPGVEPLTVTFRGDDGSVASRTRHVTTFGRPEPEAVTPPAILTATQFSIEVESGGPFAADRLTTWYRDGVLQGAHATSGSTPSTTWYFAEGATTNGFQLFYLLANPGDLDSLATMTFLCAGHAGVTRSYVVPAGRRVTIWANQEGGPLAAAECGAAVEATAPIVAERSLYLADSQGFSAGSSSVGAHAPARTWLFAEGDTRAPFETFLLLANPDTTAASVTVHYLVGPTAVSRSYVVPARQRLTVWVDQEGLPQGESAFGMRVDASVPIVAERAMWWARPGAAGWTESHTELGATAPATRWQFAHVPIGSTITILNDSAVTGAVFVRAQIQGAGGGAEAHVPVPPGRTTIVTTQLWPTLGPGTYSISVSSESVGGADPVPVVVERTSYAPGLTAGTVFLGTPDPPEP
jgi:hypothetical protein